MRLAGSVTGSVTGSVNRAARAPSVGVLALQGDSEPHREAFARLDAPAREVRSVPELDGLTHLVVPGGESTTLKHLLSLFGLWEPIVQRHVAGELALFGTCAGAILLGRNGESPRGMELLDVDVERNGYGTQVDSFTATIHLSHFERDFTGVFIRAPRIRGVGPGVRVLGRNGDEPVLVTSPGVLAATFHPELTDDPLLHRAFLSVSLWEASKEAVLR